MSLAAFLFDALAADTALNALGIDADSIHRSTPTDVPLTPRFLILAFGAETPPPGRDTVCRGRNLSIWAYDREPTYAAVETILDRVRTVTLGLEATRHTASPEAWITTVSWQGRSPDLQDDVYKAVTRNDSFLIVAG